MRDRVQPRDGILVLKDPSRKLPSRQRSIFLEEAGPKLCGNTRRQRTTWLG